MDKAIEIVPARRDDLRSIADLILESWRIVYHGIISDDYLDSMSLDQRHAKFIERYNEGRSHFLKMLADRQLIGAAVFGESNTKGYEQDGEISAIYLREDYIGKGYGHTLFTSIEFLLQEEGYTHFVVSLLSGNSRALRFYLDHGYREVAGSTLLLGEKDYQIIVLRKQGTEHGLIED